MTREDIDQLNVVEPYCFESDREELWYNVGLKDGLEIADNNLNISSLWHSASEEPICGKRLLILHTNSVVSIFNYTGKTNWSLLASCGIHQYAYISDLLPKGGGK